MIKDLIKKNRTYRRFKEDEKIERIVLEQLVDLARLSSSPMNLQSIKFILSCEKESNQVIFKTLSWAGALPDWAGPKPGERPSGYMVMLGDTSLIPAGKREYFDIEAGIWGQSIRLGAIEMGYESAMIAAIDRKELVKALSIEEHLKILVVIAFGKGDEDILIEQMKDNNFDYHRDNLGRHFVPKRSIEELIIN